MTPRDAAIQIASPWKSCGGLQVRAVDYRGGTAQSRHRHEEPGLSLVLAGSLDETSEDGTFHAVAGCLVIKPAGCWHLNDYGPRGARVVQIQPTRKSCWSELHWDYGWQETPRLARYVLALLHEQPLAEESAESSLWDAVERVVRAKRHSTEGPSPRWWHTARELLDASADQPVSVAEVARQVGVHPVYLARVCRRRLGCSVREYLRERRTLLAWHACVRDNDSLAAIAARTGFADQAHMTRSLQIVLGISPARLRRLARAAF